MPACILYGVSSGNLNQSLDVGNGAHTEPGNPIFSEQVGKLGPRFIARSLEEAILWHDGEATTAKETFRTMPTVDRAALIRFLKSL